MSDTLQTRGVIFDLKKYAIHDGPGIRTTVFFKGCPLRCWWCHNPEGRDPEPEMLHADGTLLRRRYVSDPGNEGMIGYEITVEDLLHEIEKDRIFYEQSGGGLTCSGGEPLMQIEFLADLLEMSRERGIGAVVDTSGYAPWERFERVLDLVDLFLYDIKIIDEGLHERYTGVSNRLILDNMRKLSQSGTTLLPRIPLIPGITDTSENLDGIIRFLSGLEGIRDVGLLPYNKIAEDKFRRFDIVSRLGALSMQNSSELGEVRRVFEESGYRVRFGG